MTITYKIGDATQPECEGNAIIAHVCNDIGSWGAGFVLALSKRWKEPERRYLSWADRRCEPGTTFFALGNVQFVRVEPSITVANMVAQVGTGIRDGVIPLRYGALEICLKWVRFRAEADKASVHCPRIGCGLAGGDWEKVSRILEATLVRAGIPVTVYDLPPRTKPGR